MSDQELKEAQAALAERDKALAESTAALAKMEEQLLLREAREFVTGKLAESDLPDITRLRLAGQLARNPIVADGKLDEAEMTKAVETAVAEAQAEIAAITDTGNGRITGMGGNGNPLIEAAELAESQKRISTALGSLGYAPAKEA
jgi:multidrug resistance efflux pump